MSFNFNPIEVKSGEYTVVISEGGIGVITDPGSSFTSEVKPPTDTTKLTSDELQYLADRAVEDWEEFLEGMDKL